MNYIFIVNPISGNKKALKASEAIRQYLKEKNIKFDMYYTSSKGSASIIANQFKDNPNNIIYSVGGDGTLNEIVNGLANSNAKLSVIPAGTGNDFYKSLQKCNGGKIDLGKVNNRYFINIASLGLDADVAELANILKMKKIPNSLVYYLSLIKTFFSYKNIEVTENNIINYITILAICNGTYYGGGFPVAPKAILNDGKFDICKANDLDKIQIITLLSKLIKGKHTESPEVKYYNSDSIKIKSNIILSCNVDGEIIKNNNFEFSLIKGGINIDNKDNLNLVKVLKDKKIIK